MCVHASLKVKINTVGHGVWLVSFHAFFFVTQKVDILRMVSVILCPYNESQ